MASAGPVAEADDEERRVAHVEVHENTHDDQEREGVVAQGRRARPLLQPQASQSAGASGARSDARHDWPSLQQLRQLKHCEV